MPMVRIKNLQAGDYVIPWDCSVENIHHDPEGIWIRTSDGECGYIVTSTLSLSKVEIVDY